MILRTFLSRLVCLFCGRTRAIRWEWWQGHGHGHACKLWHQWWVCLIQWPAVVSPPTLDTGVEHCIVVSPWHIQSLREPSEVLWQSWASQRHHWWGEWWKSRPVNLCTVRYWWMSQVPPQVLTKVWWGEWWKSILPLKVVMDVCLLSE